MGTTAQASHPQRSDGSARPGSFGKALRVGGGADRPGAWPALEPWIRIAIETGVPVTLCEATVGLPLPDRAGRTAWLRSLPAPMREGVTVFTDAAHLAVVWAWEEAGPAGYPVRVEHRLPRRAEALRLGLSQLPGRTGRASPSLAPADPGHLLTALSRRCPGLPSRCTASVPDLLQHIEEGASTAGLRRLWRGLIALRVLDAAAADAEWLLSAAAVLEGLGIALLERMRSWVDDSAAEGRRRAEYLRDFRETVETSEGPRFGSDRSTWLRRLIVQQNLHALAINDEAVRAVSSRLLAYAGLPSVSTPLLHANVCLIPAGPAGGSTGGDELGRALREDIEIGRRGWAVARAAALAGYAEESELGRAEAQIESRLGNLRRRVADAPLPPRSRQQGEWLLAFATVANRRDFDVIRG